MNKKELVKVFADKSSGSQNSIESTINGLINPVKVAQSIPKQPYLPPIVGLIRLSNITLNNSSGGGDGDAALADS